MDRESRHAAILAMAAGAFGVGLFAHTVASIEPAPKEVPGSQPSAKGGGPEGASAPGPSPSASASATEASCGEGSCGSAKDNKQKK